ncbi:MBL fold metallo-hydrolase [Fusibacter ferrireducens]|uniref:MBL fold metallo-hydrolase n=1 Tax=Fusibacter ferrireducens TaxID=2785058 RepID=A0ABR9ZUG3_9FIRM|nr:MBL fold metallo-hydrolase [Fusibacter ferrireducens]MBF4693601.1 MBL fold metallo-hydrolase [Fusibacter ferrireducens]
MIEKQMEVKFLGVRGSYNLSNTQSVKYGGNTSCIQIVIEDQIIFLDAGSGITKVEKPFNDFDIHILFTHYHWDHVLGLPFFSTLYTKKDKVHVKGMKPEYYSLKEVLALLFNPPFCPIMWSKVQDKLHIEEIPEQSTFYIKNIRVDTILLMHPGGALGYKISYEGMSIVLLTDIELSKEFSSYKLEREKLLKFVQGADILVMDAALTNEEYYGAVGSNKIGWGHSTMEECIHLSEDAGVKKTYITHYLPYREDQQNDALEKEIREKYPTVFLAREDESLLLKSL